MSSYDGICTRKQHWHKNKQFSCRVLFFKQENNWIKIFCWPQQFFYWLFGVSKTKFYSSLLDWIVMNSVFNTHAATVKKSTHCEFCSVTFTDLWRLNCTNSIPIYTAKYKGDFDENGVDVLDVSSIEFVQNWLLLLTVRYNHYLTHQL